MSSSKARSAAPRAKVGETTRMRMPRRDRRAFETGVEALHEPRVALEVARRVADDSDLAVPRVGQRVDRQLTRALEVEVDAGEAVAVARNADEGGRQAQLAHEARAVVMGLHAHGDDPVDERRRGDAADARHVVVGREQQHVVVVPAGGVDDGRDESHVRRQVAVVMDGRRQGEDVGRRPGEHSRGGRRLVVEFADRRLDALTGRLGDRALAREGVRDRGDRDAGGLGHIADRRHRAPPRPRRPPNAARLSKRFDDV